MGYRKPPSRIRYEKEHPMVSLRLTKELKEIVDRIKKETGKSYSKIVKEALINLAELGKKIEEKYKEEIEKLKKEIENARKKGREEGYKEALKIFINDPHFFYYEVRKITRKDIALFTAPCSICGKPMIFTHKDDNWSSKVKPTIHRAFENWYHVKCKEKRRTIIL